MRKWEKFVKKVFAFLLAFVLLAGSVELPVKAEEGSGGTENTGTIQKFTWVYDEETQTLTVTGSNSSDQESYSPFKDICDTKTVKKIILDKCYFGSFYCLFKNLSNVEEIEFSNCTMRYQTYAVRMFQDCTSLKKVTFDFADGKMSNVSRMFEECISLQNIDLSGLDMSVIKEMAYMFKNCSRLLSVDLSGKDFSSVENYNGMFTGCSRLTYADLRASNGRLGALSGANELFKSCNNLDIIKFPGDVYATNNIGFPYTYYYDSEGTAYDGASIKKVKTEDPKELYRIDPRTAYIVEFNSNIPGESHQKFYQMIQSDTCVSLRNNPYEYDGHVFLGWSRNPNSTEKDYDDKEYVENLAGAGNTIQLYGVWKEPDYAIKLDTNCPDKPENKQAYLCVYGKSYSLADQYFYRNGYRLVGWNTEPDGSGINYATDSEINFDDTSGVSGDYILYAQWELQKYTITYHLNGGTSISTNPTEFDILTEDITLVPAERTGYTFEGWYYDSTMYPRYKVEGVAVNNGDLYDRNFYANWIPNSYTVKYNGNGATEGEMPDEDTLEYDEQSTLRKNVFKREKHEFTGWNTEADGKGIKYADEADIINLSEEDGATVTLFAQWQKIPPTEYTIGYNLDGGTNASSNPESYNEETETITLGEPSKEGYTFEGWYKEAAFTNKVEKIEKGSTGNIELFAKWKKIETGNDNPGDGDDNPGGGDDNPGGSGNDNPGDGDDNPGGGDDNPGGGDDNPGGDDNSGGGDDNPGGGDDNPGGDDNSGGGGDNPGGGSNDNPGGSNDNPGGGNDTPNVPAVTATYRISYCLNGGVNAKVNPTGYEAAQGVSSFAEPERTGYTFAGWYTDASFKATSKLNEIATGTTGNFVLYAKWKANKYKITFEKGGDGVTKNMNAVNNRAYDTLYTLPANKFKRTGYVFAGWGLKEDGATVDFKDGDTYKNLKAENNGKVILYAKWINVAENEKKIYTITYKLNGGINDSINPTYYEEGTEITLKDPVKAGYDPDGWYTTAQFKASSKIGNKIDAGSNKNLTLYVRWRPKTYTILFNANPTGITGGNSKTLSGKGASVDGETRTMSNVSMGKKKTLSVNNFRYDGYTFLGWNTEPDGSGKFYKNRDSVKDLGIQEDGTFKETVTLYAQWKEKSYKVTYKTKGGKMPKEKNTFFTISSDPMALTAPKDRRGYEFKGWYTSSKYKEDSIIAEIPTGSKKNITVYAKWEKIK